MIGQTKIYGGKEKLCWTKNIGEKRKISGTHYNGGLIGILGNKIMVGRMRMVGQRNMVEQKLMMRQKILLDQKRKAGRHKIFVTETQW